MITSRNFQLVPPTRIYIPGLGAYFQDGFYMVSPSAAKDLIQFFMKEESYDHQRSLSKPHVIHLTNEMLKGRFYPEASVGFAIGRATDHSSLFMLMNGQHTISAIARLPKNSSQKLKVTIIEDTEENLRKIYGAIDTNRPRTLQVAAKAFGYHKTHGLLVSQLNSTLAAVKRINNAHYGRFTDHLGKTREMSRSLPDLLSIADMYGPDAKRFETLTKDSVIYPTLKNSVVKALLMVFLHEHSFLGGNFVRSLAFPAKTPNNNGATLYSVLHDHQTKRISLSEWEMARNVILTWNASFNAQTVRGLIIPHRDEEAVLGIKILGEEFTHQSA